MLGFRWMQRRLKNLPPMVLGCGLLVSACAPLPIAKPDPANTQVQVTETVSVLEIEAVPSPNPAKEEDPPEKETPFPTIEVKKTANTPTPTLVETQKPEELLLPEGNYEFWSIDQLLRIFQASNLIYEVKPLGAEELADHPFTAKDAVGLDLKDYCWGCWGRIFIFDAPEKMVVMQQFYQEANAQGGNNQSWVVVNRNALVQIDGKAKESLTQRFDNALQTLLPASLLRPTDYGVQAYESWDEYYPIDRGQQVDPGRGMGQRTYNRWEGNNEWQYGQASWRYQDPNGSQNPPPYFPAEYGGEKLAYFYLYHCEQNINQNPAKDCLDWRFFIELATVTNQNTEFQNWADGGWRWKTPRPPNWEIYYRPDAFGGACDKTTLRSQVSTETLQDPGIKVPMAVRLPKTVGLVQISQSYCSVHFKSYLLRARDIRDAHLGLITTENLEKTYLPETDQYQIKAINSYYDYQNEVDGEVVYKLIGYEIYWMRQVKIDNQLKNGFEAFWWFTSKLPPEEYREKDDDPTWSNYQWCYQDLKVEPRRLGRLVCQSP